MDPNRPNEVNPVTVEVNVGTTADTVRTELVLLATVLDAGVPPDSIHYFIRNKTPYYWKNPSFPPNSVPLKKN